VLDNLERAFLHAGTDPSPAFKNLATGIQMVLKQFSEVLKSQGLVRIETVGKQFDAHRHESIGYVKEKGRDHEILDEIESGYFLGDKLLRAAKVRVRVNEDPSESRQDSASSES
jgi:molecular chaperone GrpE